MEPFLFTQIFCALFFVHFCSGIHAKFINEASCQMTSLPERNLKNYNLIEETGMQQGCACVQYFTSAFAQSLCQPSQRVWSCCLSLSHYRRRCCALLQAFIASLSSFQKGIPRNNQGLCLKCASTAFGKKRKQTVRSRITTWSICTAVWKTVRTVSIFQYW